MNGQTRNIEIADRSLNITKHENFKADKQNPKHIGAPLQGLLSKLFVKAGQQVKKNEPLFVIEAMKMETTITAHDEITIDKIFLAAGTLVSADDLVMSIN